MNCRKILLILFDSHRNWEHRIYQAIIARKTWVGKQMFFSALMDTQLNMPMRTMLGHHHITKRVFWPFKMPLRNHLLPWTMQRCPKFYRSAFQHQSICGMRLPAIFSFWCHCFSSWVWTTHSWTRCALFRLKRRSSWKKRWKSWGWPVGCTIWVGLFEL